MMLYQLTSRLPLQYSDQKTCVYFLSLFEA